MVGSTYTCMHLSVKRQYSVAEQLFQWGSFLKHLIVLEGSDIQAGEGAGRTGKREDSLLYSPVGKQNKEEFCKIKSFVLLCLKFLT